MSAGLSQHDQGDAGCEKGYPADAKGIASRGLKGLNCGIGGGILSAHALLRNDSHFYLKMFPDF